MDRLTKKLLVLRGLTDNRHTVLKFSEPAGTPRAVLFGSLLDGTYNKAFLIEAFEYLSMCFGLDGSTQSEMRINAPYALVNEYTRKMMGFLAFQPRPERVLIVGLGGGSLVKYCYRYLPDAQITAVEIDPDVLALRSQFFVPPDDERLTVILADGAVHVAQMALRGERTTAVLVMNVVAAIQDAERYVETIRQVFGEAIVIAMKRDDNLVVFAGNSLHNQPHVRLAARNAERAEDRLGLFFPTLIQCPHHIADRWVWWVPHALL